MDAVVLDTNVVSFLMKGHDIGKLYRPHLEGKTLAISFMTIGELYEGAYRRNWSEKRLRYLEDQIKNYLVIPYTPEVCRVWGQVRSQRKSQPIAVDDAWIAASALVHNCPLVTHDPGDFAHIEGLTVITEHKGQV